MKLGRRVSKAVDPRSRAYKRNVRFVTSVSKKFNSANTKRTLNKAFNIYDND
jgi:hypothetical protein